jgi:phosphate transport system protein
MAVTARRLHTDHVFAAQLEELRKQLIVMAGRVEEMIGSSVDALVARDAKLAERIIRKDRRVNKSELEVDELCLTIMARWQPMGPDLRFITLSLKMVTDLERIGDLAVNICERAIDLSTQPPLAPLRDIPLMAEHAQSMVRGAINAFVASDADAARQIIQHDDKVDELYTRVFHDVLAMMLADPTAVERGIHLLSVAKWIERMGDHATNLAEQVIFMIDGKDVRHPGKREA